MKLSGSTALFLLVLALGGCGGSGGDDDPVQADAAGTTTGDVAVGGPAGPNGSTGTPTIDDANGVGDGGDPGDGGVPGDGVPDGNASAGPGVPIGANVNGGASDCDGAVPCAWTSADGALSLRLSALQGEQADGSGDLRADLGIGTTREADVALLTASSATAGEVALDGGIVTLDGEGSRFGDRAVAALVPGGESVASIEFIGSLSPGTTRVDALVVELIDGELPLSAMFANVPVGEPVAVDVDCRFELPCDWTSPDGTVTASLVAAGTRNLDERNTLAIDYRVVTTRDVSLAAEGYARATGAAGTRFSPASLRVGDQVSRLGGRLGATLAPGEGVDVTLGFDLAPLAGETALARLATNLFEVREPRVPYWNPVFLNVPLGG